MKNSIKTTQVKRVFEYFKSELNLRHNNQLATLLRVSPATLSYWIKGGYVNETKILTFCQTYFLDIQEVFSIIGKVGPLPKQMEEWEMVMDRVAEKVSHKVVNKVSQRIDKVPVILKEHKYSYGGRFSDRIYIGSMPRLDLSVYTSGEVRAFQTIYQQVSEGVFSAPFLIAETLDSKKRIIVGESYVITTKQYGFTIGVIEHIDKRTVSIRSENDKDEYIRIMETEILELWRVKYRLILS